jgi:hypothetical protein
MNISTGDPKKKADNSNSTFETRPDETPRREGGDDALAETNPSDSRMDEKVIVNSQNENKIVNAPSQSDAYIGESDSVE